MNLPSEGDNLVTHTPSTTQREDGSVTTEAEEATEGTTTQQVSSKERSAVYTQAVARLREKYREEFDGYLVDGYRAIGIEWTPKPNETQKAKAEIERLLREHPELRQLFAIGSDPMLDTTP
jgi:hypothetical protein